jgi:hypothetical protein
MLEMRVTDRHVVIVQIIKPSGEDTVDATRAISSPSEQKAVILIPVSNIVFTSLHQSIRARITIYKDRRRNSTEIPISVARLLR